MVGAAHRPRRRTTTGRFRRRRHRRCDDRVELGMDDSIDRQALIDADLDPDDPEVWASQRRVQELLICHGLWLKSE